MPTTLVLSFISRVRHTFLLGRCLLALLAVSTAQAAQAQPVQVAVAANFLSTAQQLAQRYEARHPAERILISSGSTGKLYAQISHGAPYDILLAADARRPRLLEQAGLSAPGSRFTYAIGRLVLWSRQAGLITSGVTELRHGIGRVAIANPATAPYGAAAEAVLKHLKLWQRDRAQLVRGENVGQTLQFAVTGNVKAAFVALSQVSDPRHPLGGSRWVVPAAWYPPIEQQAVLLKRAENRPAVRAFYAFLQGPQARAVIEHHGYHVPPHTARPPAARLSGDKTATRVPSQP